jgi:DEAD/DEAH box helicase domain-containing protein
MGSLHATEHALISVFPLQVMCDRGDVGGISFTHHPQVGGPAIFVYDAYPGGLGISKRAFEHLDGLVGRTLSLVQECPCEDGCPSCIHSPRCGAGNRPLDKPGAVLVMQKLLAIEEIEAPQPVAVEEEPEPPKVSVIDEVKPLEVTRQLPDKLRKKRIIAFDLETQRGPEAVGGWGNAHLMGLSLAVVKDLNSGKYSTYREEDVDDLIDDLCAADLVVGFNCVQFDFSVLSGYSGLDFGRIKVFDLLIEVQKAAGKRFKLDTLAEINLGAGKSGSGKQAISFYNEDRWDELEAYCRRDVQITADLFYLAAHEGKIGIPAKDGGVEVVEMQIYKNGKRK